MENSKRMNILHRTAQLEDKFGTLTQANGLFGKLTAVLLAQFLIVGLNVPVGCILQKNDPVARIGLCISKALDHVRMRTFFESCDLVLGIAFSLFIDFIDDYRFIIDFLIFYYSWVRFNNVTFLFTDVYKFNVGLSAWADLRQIKTKQVFFCDSLTIMEPLYELS